MDSIYILFIFIIGLIIAVGVGLELSKEIDEFIIYLLFWMLYIITIITFVNIGLVINYYLNMKNKTGPPGPQGSTGDRGDKGDTGLCDENCRDSICEKEITDMITEGLKDKNNGEVVKLNNVYIKSKIRLMCSSKEFKDLYPHNGPYNLINYIKEIWSIWFNLIYESGGNTYFENVGAESDFDWLKENPFDELKKYDIFYWGMGKQYKPHIIDMCYTNTKSNTDSNNNTNYNYIVRASNTNYYKYLGNDKKEVINPEEDEDIGALNDVSFWRAHQFTYKENTFYPVGDIAIGPIRDNDYVDSQRTVGTLTVPGGNSRGPLRTTVLVSGDVQGPMDYFLIWNNKIFWIWRPIPPTNYISLGDIVTFSATKPDTGDNAPIRCVPQDMTNKIQNDGNVLWSSIGAMVPTNVTILGYKPNDGTPQSSTIDARPNNAYNLFRGVVGSRLIIPSTDINGSFYTLNENKYDSGFQVGINTPSYDKGSDVGKGFIPTPQKHSKYSVMAYLNLKNNVVLKHKTSQHEFSATLVPNAISNAYLIKTNTNPTNTKCIDFNNNIITRPEPQCDELIGSQIFSIILTGNKKNECRIQHYNSKNYIKYKNGSVTLIDETDKNDMNYTLFEMS
jgi:hypothetical protein